MSKKNIMRGILIATASALLATSAMAAGKNWQARFDSLDTNKDGEIRQEEIKAGKLTRFREMDKNGDGIVEASEHRLYVLSKMEPRIEKRYRKMDKNNDGKISGEEYATMKHPRYFKRIDANGDGVISRDEAKQAAKRRQRHHKP